MIYLLSSKHHRHHTFWLSGLGALINQDGTKLHLGQARVTSSNAGTTDNICILRGKNVTAKNRSQYEVLKHMGIFYSKQDTKLLSGVFFPTKERKQIRKRFTS